MIRGGDRVFKVEIPLSREDLKSIREDQAPDNDVRKSAYVVGLVRSAVARLAGHYSLISHVPFVAPQPLMIVYPEFMSTRRGRYTMPVYVLKCYSTYRNKEELVRARECARERIVEAVMLWQADQIGEERSKVMSERYIEAVEYMLAVLNDLGIDILY